MKVLHVIRDARALGGAQSYALAAAAAQQRAGLDVSLLHDDPDAGPVGFASKRANGTATTLDWVERIGPDVVHLHGSPLGAALEEALVARYPSVRSLHDYAQTCGSGQYFFRDGTPCTRAHGPGCLAVSAIRGCVHNPDPRPFLRAYRAVGKRLPLVRASSAVIAHSAYVRAAAAANGVDARVVPYFVERPEQPPAPSAGRNVAFVGRLSAAKGLDVLLHALAAVPSDWERLLVVGDGWHRAECERLARRLGLADRVDWLGRLDGPGVAAAIRSARVVAVPSRWPEPFGIVGLEAMAQARAVVASRGGGIPEWLDDGETGLLVRPDDAAQLARALRTVLRDPDRAAALGRTGWERAARFSPASHLAALDAIYAEVA